MVFKLHKNFLTIITVLSTLIIFVLLTLNSNGVFADEIEAVQKEIDAQNQQLEKIKNDLNSSKQYLKDLEKNKGTLSWQLNEIKSEVNAIKAKIEENEKSIENLNGDISSTSDMVNSRLVQKNTRVQNLYYQYKFPVFEFLMNVSDFNKLMRIWEYKESAIEIDHETLNSLNQQLDNLQTNLDQIVFLKEELVSVNIDLDAKIESLNTEIAGANIKISSEQNKQNSLNSEMSSIQASIEELTAVQQELIRQKLLATQFDTSVGDVEQGVEYLESPGFADGFAFFTYGYPHRVGMNQYGAYGRAKAGQSAEQILGAYFSNIEIDKNYSTPETIPVVGYGQVDLQEYLKGLGEMPSCWDLEALKAQVIAARTYALNYIYYSWNGSEFVEKNPVSICTTQSCQVYLGGVKGGACAENWYRAVDETKNWVITYNGKPITAWYASTAGGYTRSAENVWGSHRPWALAIKDYDAEGNAFDGPQWGDSPWYHKAWGTTEKGNPWLTNEETQDLFNTYLLSGNSSSYNQYLSPVYKGGWSIEQVRNKLIELGIKPVGKISSIVVKDDGTGYTESVIIDSEEYGLKDFDGYKFRSIFNLRSPGTLVIWTSRFDVQKS